MHSPVTASRVTTAQVFAIAGPAMVANLTTPLIGIVSTTAIGRLGDATLLGGVAKNVIVTGEVTEKDGQKMINVKSIKLAN